VPDDLPNRLYAAAGERANALRQYREAERSLRDELGADVSEETRAALRTIAVDRSSRRGAISVVACPDASAPPPPVNGPVAPKRPHVPLVRAAPALEPVGGAVPLGSPFYVDRTTAPEFQAAIVRQDNIVLVKGPRQAGKSSLLARGLQEARQAGARIVLTDFDSLNAEHLTSADALLRTLAHVIAAQLDLDLSPAAWQPHRGPNLNFRRFLRREVLVGIEAPVVWGLDEVDRLFSCPFGTEVFALFRSWHNERALDPSGPWSRLALAIAYATERTSSSPTSTALPSTSAPAGRWTTSPWRRSRT
jgi:hypothetical protein